MIRTGPFLASLLALGVLSGIAGCSTTTTTSQPTLVSATDPNRVVNSEEDLARRARVRLELAQAYFGRGQLQTALDEVKVSLAADPRIAATWNLRGLIYAGMSDDAQAQDSFRHALQLNPRDADTMQNYGWYLCQQRQYAEADALFARALAVPLYASTSRTLLTRGICQAQAGQWAEAETTLQQSFELDASNPTTAFNLSQVLYHRNDLERARFYIRRVNGNPDLANAQTLWLGVRIEHRLGDARGEHEAAERLRNRFPNSREAAALDGGRFDD